MSKKQCKLGFCDKPVKGLGYCTGHFAQVKRGQDPKPLIVARNSSMRNERGEKQCRWCDEWLPVTEFGKRSDSSDGLYRYCKSCVSRRHASSRYSMSPETYDELLRRSGGACSICDRSSDKLHVDHDHKCCPGVKSCGSCVRKVLCPSCNVGLGSFRDDPDLLAAAAEYLRQHAK